MPKPNELLIKVAGTAINRADTLQRKGLCECGLYSQLAHQPLTTTTQPQNHKTKKTPLHRRSLGHQTRMVVVDGGSTPWGSVSEWFLLDDFGEAMLNVHVLLATDCLPAA